MSTYPPTTRRRPTETGTQTATGTETGTGTGTTDHDRWATADRSSDDRPRDAPLTFDPFCTRRLPNAVEPENKRV